jgi:hypothetical protein
LLSWKRKIIVHDTQQDHVDPSPRSSNCNTVPEFLVLSSLCGGSFSQPGRPGLKATNSHHSNQLQSFFWCSGGEVSIQQTSVGFQRQSLTSSHPSPPPHIQTRHSLFCCFRTTAHPDKPIARSRSFQRPSRSQNPQPSLDMNPS